MKSRYDRNDEFFQNRCSHVNDFFICPEKIPNTTAVSGNKPPKNN